MAVFGTKPTVPVSKAKVVFNTVGEMYRFCTHEMLYFLPERQYVDAVWMGQIMKGTRVHVKQADVNSVKILYTPVLVLETSSKP